MPLSFFPTHPKISIHAPRTGSDEDTFALPSASDISIHAPRTGSDESRRFRCVRDRHFNPRSPHGERRSLAILQGIPPYFNPRSPHGERQDWVTGVAGGINISIHAPRTGSDGRAAGWNAQLHADFNPRSPHGERHDGRHRQQAASDYFNPRSPHGERLLAPAPKPAGRYFNPRSPHGERRHRLELLRPHDDFNPRSPHGERPKRVVFPAYPFKFQSTLPARGATLRQYRAENRQRISIHAPRTGSDGGDDRPGRRELHFNPRSPHGERPAQSAFWSLSMIFQSTLPARGATLLQDADGNPGRISIHAPRTGSDCQDCG